LAQAQVFQSFPQHLTPYVNQYSTDGHDSLSFSAGLFLATSLAKLKINTRIIDKQAHPILRGHADGECQQPASAQSATP